MQNRILEELKEIKALIKSNSIKKYLTMRELEAHVGLSSSTIRREIQSGRLKASRKTNGKRLFSKDNIERWLNNG